MTGVSVWIHCSSQPQNLRIVSTMVWATAFSSPMGTYLSHLYEKRKASVKISHVGDLVVAREDLEEMGSRVKFSHVRSLEFDPSVGEGMFYEKVKNISHCRIVRFPETLHKLLAYAKSSLCYHYEFAVPPEAGQ